ncbi:hypothetical protein CJ20_175 [Escherichia phage CJ20]|nr:hypothetical protein CJ20_175 [Escherichia phage CJ20]
MFSSLLYLYEKRAEALLFMVQQSRMSTKEPMHYQQARKGVRQPQERQEAFWRALFLRLILYLQVQLSSSRLHWCAIRYHPHVILEQEYHHLRFRPKHRPGARKSSYQMERH